MTEDRKERINVAKDCFIRACEALTASPVVREDEAIFWALIGLVSLSGIPRATEQFVTLWEKVYGVMVRDHGWPTTRAP